jgi:dTDP-4-dehydrorhamnose 3,5-epimerase-like enzyme
MPNIQDYKMRIHTDERRQFVGDIFHEATKGDVNIVRLYGKNPICWHRHQLKADYLFVVKGVVKVGGIAPGDTVMWAILSDRREKVLYIPPNTWHGYMALGGEAILLSYVTEKWDGGDEERADFEISWD